MSENDENNMPAEVCGAILTVVEDPEYAQLDAALIDAGWESRDVPAGYKRFSYRKYTKSISGDEVSIYTGFVGDKGQAITAAEVSVFLHRINPSIVVLAGIAGSLDLDRAPLGHVVVASDVVWITKNKIKNGQSFVDMREERYHVNLHPNPDVVQKLRNYLRGRFPDHQNGIRGFSVRLGSIFSWDQVTSCKQTVDHINLRYGADRPLCVEMEAGGFVKALEAYRRVKNRPKSLPIHGFIVRGISDPAFDKPSDDQPGDDAQRDLRGRASRNAIQCAAAIIGSAFSSAKDDLRLFG